MQIACVSTIFYTSTPFPNIYPIELYEHVFTSRVENSVDPDQLASKKLADQDLHCFQNIIYQWFNILSSLNLSLYS